MHVAKSKNLGPNLGLSLLSHSSNISSTHKGIVGPL